MENWEQFLNKVIVVDTNTHFIYIGAVEKTDSDFITLVDVDCHDSDQTQTTKEKYLIDIKKCGIKPNRKKVYIRKQFIISISSLEDILEY